MKYTSSLVALVILLCISCTSQNTFLRDNPIFFLPGCSVGIGGQDEIYAVMNYNEGGKEDNWSIKLAFSREGEYWVTKSIKIRKSGYGSAYRDPSIEELATIKRVLSSAINADVFDAYARCSVWSCVTLLDFISSKRSSIIDTWNEKKDATSSNELDRINYTSDVIAEYVRYMPSNSDTSRIHHLCSCVVSLLDEGRVRVTL